MFDLDAKAKQAEFAAVVGMSQPAVVKHLQAGVLMEGGTYREWLLAYCERLREEAAGRVQSDARERRDLAQAEESEINAALKRIQLLREKQLVLDYETERRFAMDWLNVIINEINRAVTGAVSAIESKHGIEVARDIPQSRIDAARTAIGRFAQKYGEEMLGTGASLPADTTTTAD